MTPVDTIPFTDRCGNIWDLKITLADAYRIDASDYSEVTEIKFSMLDPTKEFFGEVIQNAKLQMALIWTIIHDDFLKKNNLTIDDDKAALKEPGFMTEDGAQATFIDLLDGDAIRAGKEALLAAFSDFFPMQRTVLSKVLDSTRKIEARMRLEMDSMAVDLEDMIENELTKGTTELRSKLKTLKEKPGEISTQLSEL